MRDDESAEAGWSRFSECLGVSLWSSFIGACCETAVVFACLDPLTLGVTLGFDTYLSPSLLALRPMIYALGFFVFWLFTFVSAALTAYMLSTGPYASSRPPEEPTRIVKAADSPPRSG